MSRVLKGTEALGSRINWARSKLRESMVEIGQLNAKIGTLEPLLYVYIFGGLLGFSFLVLNRWEHWYPAISESAISNTYTLVAIFVGWVVGLAFLNGYYYKHLYNRRYAVQCLVERVVDGELYNIAEALRHYESK